MGGRFAPTTMNISVRIPSSKISIKTLGFLQAARRPCTCTKLTSCLPSASKAGGLLGVVQWGKILPFCSESKDTTLQKDATLSGNTALNEGEIFASQHGVHSSLSAERCQILQQPRIASETPSILQKSDGKKKLTLCQMFAVNRRLGGDFSVLWCYFFGGRLLWLQFALFKPSNLPIPIFHQFCLSQTGTLIFTYRVIYFQKKGVLILCSWRSIAYYLFPRSHL